MTKKSVGILMLSFSTLLCCLIVIVSATFALFSDSALVKNHLQAGKLDIKLERTSLTTTLLDDAGNFTTSDPNTNVVDFTSEDSKDKNVFDLADGTKLVPGCSFEAQMKLTNTGNIACKYWIELKLDSEKTNGSEFADQLEVTLTPKNGEAQAKKLSEGYTIGSEEVPISPLLAGGTAEFTVTLTFKDVNENNSAQGQLVYFDLIVHAVQVTTAA